MKRRRETASIDSSDAKIGVDTAEIELRNDPEKWSIERSLSVLGFASIPGLRLGRRTAIASRLGPTRRSPGRSVRLFV